MFQEEKEIQKQKLVGYHLYNAHSLITEHDVTLKKKLEPNGILKKCMDPDCFGQYIKGATIAEGTTKIEDRAFYDLSIQKVKFPSTLREIGRNAFRGCYNLKDLSLPPSIEKVGALAFQGHFNVMVSEINISSLQEVEPFAFGYKETSYKQFNAPFIKCGFITDIEEGNKFPFLNCYERFCQMLLPIGDGNNIIVNLRYDIGKPINASDTLQDRNNQWNLKHQGFKGTKPKITYNWQDLKSSLTLMNLKGDKLTVQGFFQQTQGQEDLQTLVNTQHPEMAEVEWSIGPTWHDYPVKQLTCLEVIQQIFLGEYDITDPILWVYDNHTK